MCTTKINKKADNGEFSLSAFEFYINTDARMVARMAAKTPLKRLTTSLSKKAKPE